MVQQKFRADDLIAFGKSLAPSNFVESNVPAPIKRMDREARTRRKSAASSNHS